MDDHLLIQQLNILLNCIDSHALHPSHTASNLTNAAT